MKLNAIIGCLLLAGCAHSIHEVQTSDFMPAAPMASGKMVTSQSEQLVILGLTGNVDYVTEAYAKLMRACPNGDISGITTQFSTSLGFFSWHNKILMQGLCLDSKS